MWSTVYTAVFSRDGKYVLYGADNNLRVWNRITNMEVACMMGHTKYVRCIVIAKDDNTVITGSHDRTIRVWDLEMRR